ncbi:ArsR family transcriptional regulator [Dethiosulfatibacter aminovorans DSM 17477]|uniref:ArsR family transcriptional regulator n=1 Tax=Dethiosulfatibacter aminovorans DSM 17477 TaxID=1121476 RepID=A0A1M6FYW9_9FIRM|nr:metalloregulator ArsR/SmtB family transcription factor [Dethiosulfatibacter aminovorans]SHJ02896.1 ArsR family transcriptional regulator [Dethiosulfatibacter aminovorans DSM 17477]
MEHGILDSETLEKMAGIFKLLSHPSRLCIMVNLMAVKESNVSRMQNCLCEPQSTVSQHISKLKAAGLIKGTRKGTEIVYKVSDDTVKGMLVDMLNLLGKGDLI